VEKLIGYFSKNDKNENRTRTTDPISRKQSALEREDYLN
jgi:hypothetical protein